MIILKAILLMLRDVISYLFWIAVFIFGGIWLFTGFGIGMIGLLLSDGHWLMALPIILIDVILLCRIICCYMEDIKIRHKIKKKLYDIIIILVKFVIFVITTTIIDLFLVYFIYGKDTVISMIEYFNK